MAKNTLSERLERLTVAVEQLTATIQEMVAMLNTPPSNTAEAVCTHPDESRVSLSTMGNIGRFMCRECGYRND